MPCDTIRINQSIQVQQAAQDAIKKLEQRLKNRSAKIVRNGNQVTIQGWQERGGWCDACALRQLRLSQDFQVRALVNQLVPAGDVLTYGVNH